MNERLNPQLSWGDWKKMWRVCENKSLLCYSKNGVASQTTQTQEASMDNNSLSHCKWECQYHIVFIPKYRKKVLYGKVRDDIREIIKTLCKYKRVEIIAGAVCSDHVHLCVSIPSKISVSEFVSYLKGKSALMIYDKHSEMGNKWDRSFWARGYYVVTVGNITDENVKEYILKQAEESKKEERQAQRPL